MTDSTGWSVNNRDWPNSPPRVSVAETKAGLARLDRLAKPASPARERILAALRVLVVSPSDRDASRLLEAVGTALDENDAAVRAATLTEAADRAERNNPDVDVDFSAGVDWVVGELRAAATKGAP